MHTLLTPVAEPVVFLSGSTPGHEELEDASRPPPQLRGMVKLSLPRPTRVKDIILTLTGVVRTDWPEGLGQNRIEMAEQIPLLRLKTSVFRTGDGLPIPLDTMHDAALPVVTLNDPTKQNAGAMHTRIDDIGREPNSNMHSNIAARPAPLHSARKGAFKGLLDGLRLPSRPAPAEPCVEAACSSPPARAEWFELRKGDYQFPFSVSLPLDLPPTLHADFGHLEYMLKATLMRSGPLAGNVSDQREVTLVEAPDPETNAAADSIVVSRTCEDMLSYVATIAGRSFPIGTSIPLTLKFMPENKIRIHRITITLEEQTDYFANERKTMRREVPRKWTMLRLSSPRNSTSPLLPILSDAPHPLTDSPIEPYVDAAAALDQAHAHEITLAPLSPSGPWCLAMDLTVSMAQQKKINISCQHPRSNITIHHLLKITIRVESPAHAPDTSGEKRRIIDIVIGVPITLTHSHTSLEWVSLPSYESTQQPPSLLPATVLGAGPPPPPFTDFMYTQLPLDLPPNAPAEPRAPPSFHVSVQHPP
ncbi:hypothetical protein MVES1_003465 [Malassezia vespertilionis]|uniref:uncharacterized protein n=1 Tax=Malassezia vespertilionis TaxID=2020962 RepID=UPI0024B111D4|nr:uncharacterized protein MVES1_003465 [Malassezia vespertilionis]WFD08096.1 hypothetical protein MVES1_003465 [Malassezia vespertilionis]